MAELFTAETLTELSGQPVTEDQAAAIETWVIAEITGDIGALPDPVPAAVLAVALELARAAVPSPGGVTSMSIGQYSASYTPSASGAALNRDQRMRLRRAIGRTKAFTINTTAPPANNRATHL